MSTEKLAKNCDACKVKKIRCDRQRPSCGYCIRHGHHCNYSVMKKPGLKPGYGKKLSEKVDEIEEYIHAHQRDINSIASLQMKIQHLESQLVAIQTKGLSQSLPVDIDKIESINFQKYVQIYLDELYEIIPVINPLVSIPSMMSSLGTPSPILFGFVACVQPISDYSNETNQETLNKCQTQILPRCIGLQLLESIKAMTALSFALLMSGSLDFLNVFSVLVSGCNNLGLFEESNSRRDLELEEERTLIWSIYLIDALNVFINQRHYTPTVNRLLPVSSEFILSNSVLQDVPDRSLRAHSDSKYYDSRCFTIEVLHYLTEATKLIQSDSDFDETRPKLIASVQEWLEKLPENYRNFIMYRDLSFKDSLSAQDILLYLSYNLFLIAVNGCFLLDDTKDTATMVTTCKTSCRNILQILSDYDTIFNNNKLHRLGPLCIIGLFVSTRVYLLCNSKQSLDLPSEYSSTLKKLEYLANIWPLAKGYIEALALAKEDLFLKPLDYFLTDQTPMDSFLYNTDKPKQFGNLKIFDVFKI